MVLPSGKKLIRTKQLAGRIQIVAQRQGARLVKLSDNRLAINGANCAQFRKLKVMPVKEIGTVTRDDNLTALASVAKRIQKHSGGSRVQRALRFLNTDRAERPACPGSG